MNKSIPIMSTIAIMVLMNAIPGTLAVSTNTNKDATTPPLTPGYHIWHGSRYAVCPHVFPHHALTIFQMTLTTHFGKLGQVYHTSQDADRK
jgi:hypothetical protein